MKMMPRDVREGISSLMLPSSVAAVIILMRGGRGEPSRGSFEGFRFGAP
jgi:hypothetical protein